MGSAAAHSGTSVLPCCVNVGPGGASPNSDGTPLVVGASNSDGIVGAGGGVVLSGTVAACAELNSDGIVADGVCDGGAGGGGCATTLGDPPGAGCASGAGCSAKSAMPCVTPATVVSGTVVPACSSDGISSDVTVFSPLGAAFAIAPGAKPTP